jgi:hypothetical protein
MSASPRLSKLKTEQVLLSPENANVLVPKKYRKLSFAYLANMAWLTNACGFDAKVPELTIITLRLRFSRSHQSSFEENIP